MEQITAAQMKKIYALAKERAMDADLLHAYCQATVKKDSLRKLTKKDAITLIDALEGKNGRDRASCRQMQYIYGLMKQLGWIKEGEPDKERLNGFLYSRFALDSYHWLDRGTASKVIEAFKDMAERDEKKKKQEAV